MAAFEDQLPFLNGLQGAFHLVYLRRAGQGLLGVHGFNQSIPEQASNNRGALQQVFFILGQAIQACLQYTDQCGWHAHLSEA